MNERFKLDGGYIGNVNIHIAIDKKQMSHKFTNTVGLQWLKPLWNHENMFETGVVQAIEC